MVIVITFGSAVDTLAMMGDSVRVKRARCRTPRKGGTCIIILQVIQRRPTARSRYIADRAREVSCEINVAKDGL